MYRRIDDFLADWTDESKATLAVLRALDDAALERRTDDAGRTLGRLGWHLAQTLPEMLGHAGVDGVEGPAEDAPVPSSAREIAEAYGRASCSVAGRVPEAWSDAELAEEVPMYGESWVRGRVLSSLVRHQAHHRGQMTVLMRQAGLRVPGCYGPSREEWAEMGAPVPE